jgi:hypothetical protein
MVRTQKPDGPKFKPVEIADIRREIYSLAKPESEAMAMLAEDNGRIVLEKMTATMERLEVLRDHVGLSGSLGDPGDLLVMLIAVANKYVPGFEVKVGAQPKPGVKKVGDRFATVTEIEEMKFRLGLPTITLAIDTVAANRSPAIRPPELSTKYYSCLREIEANKDAAALLRLWRTYRERTPPTACVDGFKDIFWGCERDCLGATQPAPTTKLART